MYSTSIVERATHGCFLLCQEIILDPRKWQVPLVLFLSILHAIKFESEKPTRLSASLLGYHSPTLIVPLKFFRILFVAL